MLLPNSSSAKARGTGCPLRPELRRVKGPDRDRPGHHCRRLDQGGDGRHGSGEHPLPRLLRGYVPIRRRKRSWRAPKSMTGSSCNMIIVVGGGSPIDCAKGIGIVSSNKGNILDFEGVDQVPIPGPPADLHSHHCRQRGGRLPVRDHHRHDQKSKNQRSSAKRSFPTSL